MNLFGSLGNTPKHHSFIVHETSCAKVFDGLHMLNMHAILNNEFVCKKEKVGRRDIFESGLEREISSMPESMEAVKVKARTWMLDEMIGKILFPRGTCMSLCPTCVPVWIQQIIKCVSNNVPCISRKVGKMESTL